MCGLIGVAGVAGVEAGPALDAIAHRGPDAEGAWTSPGGEVWLGHRRLSIIDLSDAGRQPLATSDGRYHLVFNGEIYNYLELRQELAGYPFTTATDSEVLLAAYARWGTRCVEHLVGMFAFLIWDEVDKVLFAARDRFGVKPLLFARMGSGVAMASETRPLRLLTGRSEPDPVTWASYLAHGTYGDHGGRTFWDGIESLPGGHALTWQAGTLRTWRWYDVAAAAADIDGRPDDIVEEEYLDLLLESVGLRFRADVPVGINLSGGLDSSTLLAAVHGVQGPESQVKAFTFVTGHPDYDELPWVREMLAQTKHPLVVCPLAADEVPLLAERVMAIEDEPYGGLPTLAYARLFEHARGEGVTVLLDGQGMDEQWAGYGYYARAVAGEQAGVVQGTAESPVRPECLVPEFRALAEAVPAATPFGDPLRDAQHRDLTVTKLPRALRFNDRASMMSSRELREPFLDHRLVELALRQPAERKIRVGQHKWMLRKIVAGRLPAKVVEAPKRPMQTPQREWLRGPLAPWARERVEVGLERAGGSWLDPAAVRRELDEFLGGRGDNSFYVWQWITLGLAAV